MKKLIKNNRLLFFLLSIPYIIIILLHVIHINYDVTTIASIDEIENVISISNETQLNGSINVVSVYSYEKVNVLSYIIGKLNPYATVDESVKYTDINYDDLILGGTWQKKVSLNNAIISGYKAAGYDINYDFKGYIIHSKATYLDKDLAIGDVITHINGVSLSNETDPQTVIHDFVDSLPTLKFTVIKNYNTKQEEVKDVDVTAKKYKQDGKWYFSFGFSSYALNIPRQLADGPTFSINWSNVKSIGPSGGLLQSFYVYEKLTNATLSDGLKIAGTGTVDIDGNAGAIGGIRQKIFTANLSGVDIFFVPVSSKNYENDETETNYIEAKAAYETLHNPHMKMVPVASVYDIIDYLKTYKESTK